MRVRRNALSDLPTRQAWLLGITLALAVLSLVDSPYPTLAPLQNVPTIILAGAGPWLLARWPLSDRALTCICAFLWLLTLGGRYAYSYVPYDAWSVWLTGASISETLGLTRNHYDRLVHFAFGALSVLPALELLRRHLGVGRRASLYVVVEFVLAISALYEIFEWLLTLVLAGEAANEYNGQQGDFWDAQHDMGLALTGSVTMLAVLVLRNRNDVRGR